LVFIALSPVASAAPVPSYISILAHEYTLVNMKYVVIAVKCV